MAVRTAAGPRLALWKRRIDEPLGRVSAVLTLAGFEYCQGMNMLPDVSAGHPALYSLDDQHLSERCCRCLRPGEALQELARLDGLLRAGAYQILGSINTRADERGWDCTEIAEAMDSAGAGVGTAAQQLCGIANAGRLEMSSSRTQHQLSGRFMQMLNGLFAAAKSLDAAALAQPKPVRMRIMERDAESWRDAYT